MASKNVSLWATSAFGVQHAHKTFIFPSKDFIAAEHKLHTNEVFRTRHDHYIFLIKKRKKNMKILQFPRLVRALGRLRWRVCASHAEFSATSHSICIDPPNWKRRLCVEDAGPNERHPMKIRRCSCGPIGYHRVSQMRLLPEISRPCRYNWTELMWQSISSAFAFNPLSHAHNTRNEKYSPMLPTPFSFIASQDLNGIHSTCSELDTAATIMSSIHSLH